MKAWVDYWEFGAWDNIECSAQRGYVCQTFKGRLLSSCLCPNNHGFTAKPRLMK